MIKLWFSRADRLYKCTKCFRQDSRRIKNFPYRILKINGRLLEKIVKFGLEVSEEKTKIIEFGRFANKNRKNKVLKKHKNNGFRDVLLGNGQVWRLHKEKKKGMLRKKIARRNRYISDNNIPNKRKMKTVHYTIIKRIS